ncbi:hypothetical protein [Halobacillus sp. Marseille-Q1614]|uniref:hypothetical protein n=1 Tax=Halobacillus sp. Marseille-Q1614 TaxID=2709134 RepID=UPI00156DAF2D|nr:hypothetical protein [Halobacillus sp. Marseille-Q1614]
MKITYSPAKLGHITDGIAIHKGKYVIGWMNRFFQTLPDLNDEQEVSLEVVSEVTKQTYTIQQKTDLQKKWTVFQKDMPIGSVEMQAGKKHKLLVHLSDHSPLLIESTWKKTGLINKKGTTIIKGLWFHKIHIDINHEMDAALLAGFVHIFWSTQPQN